MGWNPDAIFRQKERAALYHGGQAAEDFKNYKAAEQVRLTRNVAGETIADIQLPASGTSGGGKKGIETVVKVGDTPADLQKKGFEIGDTFKVGQVLKGHRGGTVGGSQPITISPPKAKGGAYNAAGFQGAFGGVQGGRPAFAGVTGSAGLKKTVGTLAKDWLGNVVKATAVSVVASSPVGQITKGIVSGQAEEIVRQGAQRGANAVDAAGKIIKYTAEARNMTPELLQQKYPEMRNDILETLSRNIGNATTGSKDGVTKVTDTDPVEYDKAAATAAAKFDNQKNNLQRQTNLIIEDLKNNIMQYGQAFIDQMTPEQLFLLSGRGYNFTDLTDVTGPSGGGGGGGGYGGRGGRGGGGGGTVANPALGVKSRFTGNAGYTGLINWRL